MMKKLILRMVLIYDPVLQVVLCGRPVIGPCFIFTCFLSKQGFLSERFFAMKRTNMKEILKDFYSTKNKQ